MPIPTINETDDLTTSTAATMSETQIKAALDVITNKSVNVQYYEGYYDGSAHPVNFASERFRTEFGGRIRKMRDNLCRVSVQAPADRLEVIGFSADKGDDLYKTTWDIWKRSLMPKVSREVHRDAFKTGDGFVIVWPDADGRAKMHRQDPDKCAVFYDPETGSVEWGAKLWRGLDGFVYLTLYFRDRIEKYISRNKQSAGNSPKTSASYEKRTVEGETWPLENETGICPLIHFSREDSILADVVPLQDGLNKTLADLLVASEANSMQQRYVTGLSYELDPETGKQIIPFDRAASWFMANATDAKFGNFAQIGLKDILETVNDFRNEVSTVTGIPKYYFRLDGGSFPSGEALRKAESRFTSLIKDAQLDFGEPWAVAMRLALKIEGKDAGTQETGTMLETAWTPPDPMSANEMVDLAIKKKQVGVSTEVVLSEIGYTDEAIGKMAEQNADAQATAGEAFNKAFNAGPKIG